MSASSNAILAQCKFPKLKQGLQVLSSLHSLPQPSFFSSLLQLCIDYNADREGRFLHRHLLHSPHASHMHLNTKFIIFYAKVGDLDAARRVFDGMHQRTVVSWTALMSGYSQNGYPGKALEVFLGMRRSGLKANQFGYGSALRACTRLLSIDSGTQMQACIEKSRFSGDMFVLSALVDLHSKCGAIDDAVSVFGKMEQRDVVCWNALIGGYASQEMGHCAFRMFHWMLREGVY
ncbi:hypothetical protein ACLOJK_029740 [Asimina triloba]